MTDNSNELMNATKHKAPPGGTYGIAALRFEFNMATFHVPDGDDCSQIFLQNLEGVAPYGYEGWDMVGNPFMIAPGESPYVKDESSILASDGPKEVEMRKGVFWGIMMKRMLVPVAPTRSKIQVPK